MKVVELFIEKSDRTSNWNQLIAKCEDGSEWIICGSYCGGIPESHWQRLTKSTTPLEKETDK